MGSLKAKTQDHCQVGGRKGAQTNTLTSVQREGQSRAMRQKWSQEQPHQARTKERGNGNEKINNRKKRAPVSVLPWDYLRHGLFTLSDSTALLLAEKRKTVDRMWEPSLRPLPQPSLAYSFKFIQVTFFYMIYAFITQKTTFSSQIFKWCHSSHYVRELNVSQSGKHSTTKNLINNEQLGLSCWSSA